MCRLRSALAAADSLLLVTHGLRSKATQAAWSLHLVRQQGLKIARIGVAAGFFEIGGQDMIPETFRNPHSNLPFELFRSFGPMFDKHRPFTAWTPPCDIYETDKEIVLKMELPEMRKENVQVTLEKNVLTLRGERKRAEKVNRENYHRIERTYGEFVRIFTLPTSVEGSTVLAEFKEGMLTVMVSKNKPAILRQIGVKIM